MVLSSLPHSKGGWSFVLFSLKYSCWLGLGYFIFALFAEGKIRNEHATVSIPGVVEIHFSVCWHRAFSTFGLHTYSLSIFHTHTQISTEPLSQCHIVIHESSVSSEHIPQHKISILMNKRWFVFHVNNAPLLQSFLPEREAIKRRAQKYSGSIAYSHLFIWT